MAIFLCLWVKVLQTEPSFGRAGSLFTSRIYQEIFVSNERGQYTLINKFGDSIQFHQKKFGDSNKKTYFYTHIAK